MFWQIVLYNLMLLPVDAAVIVYIWQRRNWGSCVLGVMTLGVSSLFVALTLSGNFLILRLTCIGWFAHIPAILFVGAGIVRKRSRLLAATGFMTGLALVTVAVDAFWLEPTWLEETHYSITSSKLSHPLRIVVLADVQTDAIGQYERRVLQRTLDLKPDMILMAGDYLQVDDKSQIPPLRAELNAYLREIGFAAPLGVYAVEGNNDTGSWFELFDGLPVHATWDTRPIDLENIRVTCLSMSDSFMTDTRVSGTDKFHIALGHAPNFALGDIQADLLVAGHTHGGQVRLPGLGPIVTLSAVPRKWATGMTDLGTEKKLVVSRGIGMERASAPRLRFLCRPELVIIDVEPMVAANPKAAKKEIAKFAHPSSAKTPIPLN
jgi:predicted MPP superfamily phosphohydrolase